MTYAISAALQGAVYGALAGDAGLSGLVGGAIFDAEPAGSLPELYVTLGPESVRAGSDGSGGGAVHEFIISVVTDAAGFSTAKQAGVAVCDLLIDADLELDRGRLVSCRFLKAKAARAESGTARRIDLTFRARVDDG
ncbi:DUF3168 domain-containing protein [uncultured Litoreibacter sp.]|uniref:DUF3168 domain-containing protein n=1 Tax=uncultured Litoreibacter sp. TaxID=1392394 RepID=UPI002617B1EF|nr:DUF3168 domain-containing protein [uncultured Litoreibacter sp.]